MLSTVADNVRDTIPFPSTVTACRPGFIYFSSRRALHNVPRVQHSCFAKTAFVNSLVIDYAIRRERIRPLRGIAPSGESPTHGRKVATRDAGDGVGWGACPMRLFRQCERNTRAISFRHVCPIQCCAGSLAGAPGKQFISSHVTCTNNEYHIRFKTKKYRFKDRI